MRDQHEAAPGETRPRVLHVHQHVHPHVCPSTFALLSQPPDRTMDEQKKQPEASRNAAPASPPPGRDPGPGPGAVKRHRGRTIALIVAVVVIAGIVLVRWHPWNKTADSASAAAGASGAQAGRASSGGRRGGAGGANQPQPVHVATVKQGEMPVVLNALGTVTPLANVTVRTQLTGTLQTVAFQEGQMVNKGDLLAQVDPRPYQISLANAEGTLAKDTAL